MRLTISIEKGVAGFYGLNSTDPLTFSVYYYGGASYKTNMQIAGVTPSFYLTNTTIFTQYVAEAEVPSTTLVQYIYKTDHETGAIIGTAFASVFGTLLLVGLFVLFRRYRSGGFSSSSKTSSNSEMTNNSTWAKHDDNAEVPETTDQAPE